MADLWMSGVTHDPQGGGVTLNQSLPARGVWHITWDAVTNGVQPAMANVGNYLKTVAYCPHLLWNPFTGEIVQYYPANVGGRALNAWNEDGKVNIQVEIYFSPGVVNDGKVYNTVAETPCKNLDKILAWMDSWGVPRTWPMGAPQWQGNSRDVNIWNTKAGHYGHCNVPQNTHTDPGPMPSLGKAGTTPPVVTPPKPAGKTIAQLADETIAGKYGNGDQRIKALGSNYNAVMAEVNRRLGAAPAKPAPKPAVNIGQLAADTIAGKFGNGDARVKALGANYNAVMAEVNRRLGAEPAKPAVNISALADAVLRGEYGDGADRQRRLGANYAAVQAEVNRRFS